ncbi:hypothetical protein B7C51_00295 [Paenibacillus larvae subsp. pulvifaciens]|uniref:Uncharacterized protein n=1 Tax=Paenibacillus larvae subsp. pulvifaciens TaxID=1477 RepID=A0A1V0UNC0_9BACL|nr:hypothetical protein B7C51_00295 [Paenibacillus larvae subsp. pulvifaciens]
MLHASDSAMDTILKTNAEAGMPAIDVAPNQEKLLYLLAKMTTCRANMYVANWCVYFPMS